MRADLAALAIPFAEHQHRAVFTVAESRAISAAIPGAHTKNLFLKDAGGAFWLLTVPAAARVDMKALAETIRCRRVSFAPEDDMRALLGIAPGSVTPLALINAAPGAVTAVLDRPLAEAARINVHPLRNTATVGIAGADVLRLLRHWDHEAVVLDVPQKRAA